MRLVYFASPYELLDVDRPGQDRQFTREGTYSTTKSGLTGKYCLQPARFYHPKVFIEIVFNFFWDMIFGR